MFKKSIPALNSTHMCKSRGYSKILSTIIPVVLLFIAFALGCKKDKFVAIEGVCPLVVTDPLDKAVDVMLSKVITATFNTPMDAGTITKTTFIVKQNGTAVSGTVAATADEAVYTFTPDLPLSPFLLYTGTITTDAADKFNTALQSDYTWTFTTIPEIKLTSSPTAGGTTSGAGKFAQGSVTSVTAMPNTGFVFTNWTENAIVVSTSSSYQFTMAGNRTLVANFAPVIPGSFAVVLSSAPVAGGVTGGSGSYIAGSTVATTATPAAGYTFVNWTEGGTVVSASSNYQFVLSANRTLVANFKVIPASQLALILSSSPAAGGSTSGSGSYAAGTSVTATAAPNVGYSFANWTENGNVVSTSPAYTFALSASRTLVANFTISRYALTLSANPTAGGTITGAGQYNAGSVVLVTATPGLGYVFSSWSGDATGTNNPLTVTMNANKSITANFTPLVAIGPGQVNLGLAGNYNMLTKTGISTTGVTSIQGDLGVSPAAATAITGFGLIMDASGQFSRTPIVTGKVYAADYAAPTPSNLTTAVNDMQTAYTTANGLVTPAPVVDLGAGDISGRILPPGLYKWSTGLLVTNAGVTLAGGPNDTWVLQIAQDLTVNNSAIVTLTGGAQAKNIVWVVAGQAVLGSNVDFSGILLSKTLISVNTNSKVKGRLLAQTAVTLNADIITLP